MNSKKEFRAGFTSPVIESALAFDLRKKAFLLDLMPTTTDEVIPHAMEIIDAMLPLEDIVHDGIIVSAIPKAEGQVITNEEDADMFDVTVTITSRRPAKFFVPLKDKHGKLCYKTEWTATPEEVEKHDRWEAAIEAVRKSPEPSVENSPEQAKLDRIINEMDKKQAAMGTAHPVRSEGFKEVIRNRAVALKKPLRSLNQPVLTTEMAVSRMRYSLLHGLVLAPRHYRMGARSPSRIRQEVVQDMLDGLHSAAQQPSLQVQPTLLPARRPPLRNSLYPPGSNYSSSVSLSSGLRGSESSNRWKPARRPVPLRTMTPLRWSHREGLVMLGRLPGNGRLSAFAETKIVNLQKRRNLSEALQARRQADERAMEAELEARRQREEAELAQRYKRYTPANRPSPIDRLLKDASGWPHGYGYPKVTSATEATTSHATSSNATPLGHRAKHGYNTQVSNAMPSSAPLPVTPAATGPTPTPLGLKRVQTGVLRWRRATEHDFSISFCGSEAESGPIVVDADVEHKVNQWLSYRFHFSLLPFTYRHLQRCLRQLRLLEEEADQRYLLPGPTLLLPPMQSIIEDQPMCKVLLAAQQPLDELPFQLRYLIEGLVSHSILQTEQVIPAIEEMYSRFRDGKTLDAKRAAVLLESLFFLERIDDIGAVFEKRSKLFRKGLTAVLFGPGPAAVDPGRPLLIHKGVVTPTRLILMPPARETSNSILRRFPEHVDRFLRVQFNDEDGQLQVNKTVKDAYALNDRDGTIARVRRALDYGLVIASRRYVFLAASASQAREHSCWFFAETAKLKADDIRRSFGDLSKETIIAKYAARQGLPFASTMPINIVCKLRKPAPDIKNGPYTFTDGVGKCAQNVCDQAAVALGFPNLRPSAIQIRIGGSKGVLSAWPQIKSREVFLRPSMIKFDAPEQKDIHVVRIAMHRTAFLNRQFIMLLSALGIPDALFTDLFASRMSCLKGLASRARQGKLEGESLAIAQHATTFPVVKLLKLGFENDPVLLDVLEAVERRLFADLRWNARVEVKNGAYLLGIADEVNVLAPNEVFCQIETEEGELRVITGPCIICRAPALHPGDIRRVQAVDKPELQSMRNVIVFSVQGDRDLPNMLGGGDLDGDDFTLIWDKGLIDIEEVPAADYTAQTPKRVAWVTQEDVMDNFNNYILNDILGICSNAHLAWADQLGAKSDKCLELCQVAATAVDFAKTGIPAELPEQYRPERWPDFMGKQNHMTYPGKSILGTLFRMVASNEPDAMFIPIPVGPDHPKPWININLRDVPIPKSVLNMTAVLKMRFDFMIASVLRRYKVTEIEIIAGVVLRNPNRKRAKDGDLKDPLRDAWKEAVETILALATHAMPKVLANGGGQFTPLQILAVAAYRVTYESLRPSPDDDVVFDEEDMPSACQRLKSFAWILPQELMSVVQMCEQAK